MVRDKERDTHTLRNRKKGWNRVKQSRKVKEPEKPKQEERGEWNGQRGTETKTGERLVLFISYELKKTSLHCSFSHPQYVSVFT